MQSSALLPGGGGGDGGKLPSVVFAEISGADDNGDLILNALQFPDIPATILLPYGDPAAARLRAGDRVLARLVAQDDANPLFFEARIESRTGAKVCAW
jgi:hypothetical protein